MRHTRWLIPYFQVWHSPHLLAHPSLVGCVATTPIIMYHLQGCCCHPQICQGAPNNLSPIYCQMVVNFIVYLDKRLKLLTYLQYIKRKKIKGQLTPVGNFNSNFIKLKKIYMLYKHLVSFPSLSFSFSGDYDQVVKRLQKSQQRLPLF